MDITCGRFSRAVAAAVIAALILALTTFVAGAPAQAAETGAISGTVTAPNADDPDWWRGVRVDVDGPDYWSAGLDENGTYTFTGLEPGDYTVRFWVRDYYDADRDAYVPVNLVSKYYDDASDWGDATPVTVGAGEATTGIDTALSPGGTITGNVTAPEGANPNWWKAVTVEADGPAYGDAAIDQAGNYTITGLTPGDYTVQFSVGGYYDEDEASYIEVNLAPEYYNNVTARDDATPVTVSSGQTQSGIDAALTGGGTITGTVTAPTADHPDWWTDVYVEADGAGWGSASLDSNGAYSITGLVPGDYTVRFVVGAPDSYISANLLSEYYDDAARSDDATTVTVTAGVPTTGIDAELASAGAISGHVTVTNPDDPNWWKGVMVEVSGPTWRSAYLDEDGNYTVTGLTPGDYTLQFWVEGYWDGDADKWVDVNLVPQYYDNADSWNDATPVTVSAGQTSQGVDAHLVAGGTIAGHVSAPAGTDPDWWKAVRVSADGNDDYGSAPLDQYGNYTITGLNPDDYRVRFNVDSYYVPATDSYVPVNLVSEYYDDAIDYNNATLVTVAAATTTADIDADLAAGATITGRVTATGASDPNWWKGIAVGASGPQWKNATLDSNGDYTLTGLAAGDYLVEFFVDGYWDTDLDDWVEIDLISEYYDNAYTYEDATPISVTAGDLRTGVDGSLAPGGRITGKVTAPGATDPNWWQGVHVFAEGPGYGSANIDQDGNYTISRLAPGNYAVQFRVEEYWDEVTEDDVPVNLASEYYDDAATAAQATPVAVTSAQTTPGINASLAPAATISGHVSATDPDDPNWWKGVRVYVEGPDYGGASIGADGNYTITGIDPGTYTVWASVGSYYDNSLEVYVPVNLLSQSYSGEVTLASGDSRTGVDVNLQPGSRLTGTISGKPGHSDYYCLSAATTDGEVVQHGCFDDKDGLTAPFSFAGLPAQTYVLKYWDEDTNGVYLSGAGVDSWTTVIGTTTNTGALAVPQSNATIKGSLTISGFSAAAPEIGSSTIAEVYLYQYVANTWIKSKGKLTNYAGKSNGTYNYSIPGLAPGTYRVGFEESQTPFTAGGTVASQWFDGSPSFGDATDITVTAGQTLSNVSGSVSPAGASEFTATPTPTISGDTTAGSTLTATAGTWSPTPDSFSYQWLRNDTPIDGATGSTYELTADDQGTTITVSVTGSKPGYASVTNTSDVLTIPNVFSDSPAPTIAGATTEGSLLVAQTTAWSPTATFAYQWLRNGAAIGGATDSTYVVQAADRGTTIMVAVTGSKLGYTSVTKTSVGLAIPNVFTASATPTITGSSTAGSTLAALPGTWTPAPDAFGFQWLRNDTPIDGATGSTYQLTATDVGTTVKVAVTGSKPGYTSVTKTSAGRVISEGVKFTTTPTPTVSGTKTSGSTLTVKTGTWIPTPDSFGYQWLRNGSPIDGATASTYKLTTADRATTITVAVTGIKSGYIDATKTSAGLAIPGVFTAPVPTISGTLKSGSTLTAKAGTWTPKATLTYQWYRNGTAIKGATKSTYKLTTTDRGKKITVKVTGKKTGYTTASKTSAAKAIPKVFTKTPTPTISGTVKVGKKLTAKAGTWSPKPTFTYQWYRNGTAITGATKSTYTLTKTDKGKKITVKVTGKKSGYTTVTKTSSAKKVS